MTLEIKTAVMLATTLHHCRDHTSNDRYLPHATVITVCTVTANTYTLCHDISKSWIIDNWGFRK